MYFLIRVVQSNHLHAVDLPCDRKEASYMRPRYFFHGLTKFTESCNFSGFGGSQFRNPPQKKKKNMGRGSILYTNLHQLQVVVTWIDSPNGEKVTQLKNRKGHWNGSISEVTTWRTWDTNVQVFFVAYLHGWSTYPPLTYPPRNKALLRAY